jgi:hypothetical protein
MLVKTDGHFKERSLVAKIEMNSLVLSKCIVTLAN